MLRRIGPVVPVIAVLSSILVGCTDSTSSSEPVDQAAEYEKERVTYTNAGTVLSGILWLPRNPGPHPALVIVDGSGKTRAERMEAWIGILVDSGFACLSYDKRGVGDSGGTYRGGMKIDIPLLASDVVAGVNYLKIRKEVDGSRIGLLGVSQAGWIIPVAAVESENVSFTVVVSGTTVTLGEENYYSQLTGDDPFWKFVYRNLSREEISRRLAKRGPSLFDPRPYLEKMTGPGLWVFGELDRSQPTRESVVLLDGLIREHNKEFTYKVFEGADHSIWIDGEPVEGVLKTIKDWLLVRAAKTPAPS